MTVEHGLQPVGGLRVSTWDFRIGQRVVCVCDEGCATANVPHMMMFTKRYRFEHNLVRDQTYTIVWTGLMKITQGPLHCVAVAGGHWIGAAFGDEVSDHPHPFPANWFRPLETRKTSIEVFEKILKGEPVSGAFDPVAFSGNLRTLAHDAACSPDRNPS